jgi:hypothetical protein
MKQKDLQILTGVILDMARWTVIGSILAGVWWGLDTAFVQTMDHLAAGLAVTNK